MAFCRKCGAEIPEDVQSCGSCGAATGVQPPEQTTVAPPPLHVVTHEQPKKVLGIGCGGCLSIVGGLVIIAVVISVAVAMFSGGGSKNKATATTINPNATWVKIFSAAGITDKRTAAFTLTGAPARMTYKVTGNDFPVCSIYIMGAGTALERNGGIPEIMATDPVSDTTMLSQPAGIYYLAVQCANCGWDVTIEEQR
jgi:hypothetical protein